MQQQYIWQNLTVFTLKKTISKFFKSYDKWALTRENLFSWFANNKGADQGSCQVLTGYVPSPE